MKEESSTPNNEFYVGYLPKAPAGLAKRLLRVVVMLNVVSLAVAFALVLGQSPFSESVFEFLNFRDFEGIYVRDPYPGIMIRRPAGPEDSFGFSRYLLVAPGKHGFAASGSAEGLKVRMKGSLIYRANQTMVEVAPGSFQPANGVTEPGRFQWTDLGTVALYGEIVDTKCYLGVMNPGNGKVHRACAVRCISGGIPPGLLAKDMHGRATVLLLAGADGRPLNREVLDFVAEPVRIEGRLLRMGDALLLKAEPKTFYRVARDTQ